MQMNLSKLTKEQLLALQEKVGEKLEDRQRGNLVDTYNAMIATCEEYGFTLDEVLLLAGPKKVEPKD